MSYCTIIVDGLGRPHRFYADKFAAVRAAGRLARRVGGPVDVAWCRDGVPKFWVAHISRVRVFRTHWTHPKLSERA